MSTTTKFLRISEIIWIVIASIALAESVIRWPSKDNKLYIFIGFTVFGILMFFIRRGLRKKLERNSQQNPKN